MSDMNKHYLAVNAEEYQRPTSALSEGSCKQKSRSSFLGMRKNNSMVMFDDMAMQKSADSSNNISENSLYADDLAATSSESSNSLSGKKRQKSIENLCFGVRNRKNLHRKTHVTQVHRSRCYTDPEMVHAKRVKNFQVPILRIPEGDTQEACTPSSSPPYTRSPTPSNATTYERRQVGNNGVFGSLLKQTLKVTSASMGFRAVSVERLAPYTSRPLSEDVKHRFSRSTSSVSTLAQLPPDSLAPMAPLQTHTEAHSIDGLNSITDKDNYPTTTAATNNTQTSSTTKSSSSPPQQSKTSKRNALQHQLSLAESTESTSIGCATSSEYTSARSLKHSSTSLAPLQSVPSTASLRSISPSRPNSNSSSTAKHEQSSAAATAAAAAAAGAATTSTGSATNATTPPEKEKKRKEVSSSRVKKFHRHFPQVSKDEKLINYFSCALVSDILLQGHLYITDQHFAFYSNVFGYVTKVVIPTSSVTKISKEKTAKIIPNAVGVATADERHVFGSFISREAAFRLMVSVCSPLAPAEILVKDPAIADVPEEYSIEDDSSCSISGNESPAQVTENGNSSNENHHSDTQLLRRSVGNSNLSIAEEKLRHSDIPLNAKTATSAASLHLRASAPPPAASTGHYGNGNSSVIAGGGGGIAHIISKISSSPATAIGCATIEGNLTFIAAGNASTTTSATTTPTPSTSSSPTTVMALPHTKAYQFMHKFRTLSNKLMVNVKFPTEIHVVYLGVTLTILLAVFTVFLLYRILDIEAKTSVYRSPVEFNWHSGNDDDIFAEALRFQKQLQLKSTEEAQNILKTNLEQIAKVRRSLETLSMLIHDRSSSFSSSPNTDDSD